MHPDERIPPERLERNPLITSEGWRMFRRIRDQRSAPPWNYAVGDRLLADDLPAVEAYRRRIAEQRPRAQSAPPDWLLGWVTDLRERVPLFRERLPMGFDLGRDWAYIETMSREDIVSRIHRITPLDADLSRLIVYETNGTSTGHPLDVPNHPGAVARNHPLLEFALARHGVVPEFTDRRVACVNVGAEAGTVMFPNVFAVWNNAGFAKVNIHEKVWTPERAGDFLASLQPQFLTGDPVAFSELARWGVDYGPRALISTATTLSAELRRRLGERYDCPVIDFYSTTETGPIAYSAPDAEGLSLIAPDLYLEILDEEGFPLPPGELGEITLSGGRNPYLPLLRYRTGDFARLVADGAPGDVAPRLLDLHARQPLLFLDANGNPLHPLDISTALRPHLWVQHELLQRADASLQLTIKPGLGCSIDQRALQAEFAQLFGDLPCAIIEDPRLGRDRPGGKVIAFRSELSPGFL